MLRPVKVLSLVLSEVSLKDSHSCNWFLLTAGVMMAAGSYLELPVCMCITVWMRQKATSGGKML